MTDPFHLTFVLFTGLCLGSFASLLAYRLPRGLPWAATRSKCPACGHALGVRDLVPLLSWMSARGKCRYCKARVPARYPLLEIAGAVIGGALYMMIGWHWALVPALAAVPFGMAFVIMRLSPDVD